MSKYVESDTQSLIFHHKTELSADSLNNYLVNILEPGVLYFEVESSDIGTSNLTIKKGNSFIIQPLNPPYSDFVGKLDIVQNFQINVSGYADGTYYLYVEWNYSTIETEGADFRLESTLPVSKHVYIGEVEVSSGLIQSINILNRRISVLNHEIETSTGYSKYFLMK